MRTLFYPLRINLSGVGVAGTHECFNGETDLSGCLTARTSKWLQEPLLDINRLFFVLMSNLDLMVVGIDP
jgi:hypothetical protein